MLDQNVPNPFAKTPNFHTHKVFASIGIILIAMIIIGGGIWYFVQSAEDKAGTVDDNTVNKTATSSAKTATSSATKDETADWKTYTSKTFSVKYPEGWLTSSDASDLENIVFKNAGMKVTIIIITEGGVSPNTQGSSKSETTNVEFNDTITKANEITYSDGTWKLFTQSGGSNGEWYELDSTKIPTTEERTTMITILSTFKFL